jgi:hypothetical protein
MLVPPRRSPPEGDTMRLPLAVGLVSAIVTPAARADECASVGPQAFLLAPSEGDRVPPSFRFRLWIGPGCGGIPGAPAHRVRVVGEDGVVVEHRETAADLGGVEIVPVRPLAPGEWELQMRRPVSGEALGDWEHVASVVVAGEADGTAPRFDGIAAAEARAVGGLVPLSPCEMRRAWVLRTTVRFAAAEDPPWPHDHLLYLLDRRTPDAAAWQPFRTFRPHAGDDGRVFSWESAEGWNGTWVYRLRVRDFSGNETIGERIAEVTAPERPAGEPPPERATEPVPDPVPAGVEPDAPHAARVSRPSPGWDRIPIRFPAADPAEVGRAVGPEPEAGVEPGDAAGIRAGAVGPEDAEADPPPPGNAPAPDSPSGTSAGSSRGCAAAPGRTSWPPVVVLACLVFGRRRRRSGSP